MVSEDDVLKVVRSRSYRQMTTEELARRLSVPNSELDEFVALLEGLERGGHLVRVKKTHWSLPTTSPARVRLLGPRR